MVGGRLARWSGRAGFGGGQLEQGVIQSAVVGGDDPGLGGIQLGGPGAEGLGHAGLGGIAAVEDQDVGGIGHVPVEGHAARPLRGEVGGAEQSDDGPHFQAGLAGDLAQEVQDPSRIRHAAGLDDQPVERALEHALDAGDQAFRRGAAHTAAGHGHHPAFAVLAQDGTVEAGRTEVIDDDAHLLLARVAGQEVQDGGGLADPEGAGDDIARQGLFGRHGASGCYMGGE